MLPKGSDKYLNYEILEKLNDVELGKMCQVNQKMRELCKNDYFWEKRFKKRFNEVGINWNDYKERYNFQTWRSYYIDLVNFLEHFYNGNIWIYRNDKNDRDDFQYLIDYMTLKTRKYIKCYLNEREEKCGKFKDIDLLNPYTLVDDIVSGFETLDENGGVIPTEDPVPPEFAIDIDDENINRKALQLYSDILEDKRTFIKDISYPYYTLGDDAVILLLEKKREQSLALLFKEYLSENGIPLGVDFVSKYVTPKELQDYLKTRLDQRKELSEDEKDKVLDLFMEFKI